MTTDDHLFALTSDHYLLPLLCILEINPQNLLTELQSTSIADLWLFCGMILIQLQRSTSNTKYRQLPCTNQGRNVPQEENAITLVTFTQVLEARWPKSKEEIKALK